jgi:hypothetical protein
VKAIGIEEIRGASHWLLGDEPPGDGSRYREWGEARGIDLAALAAFADNEAVEALRSVAQLGRGELRQAVRTAVAQGVVTGIEIERRRRDAEAMPL